MKEKRSISSKEWMEDLLLEQPQGFTPQQKILSVDKCACRYMENELKREKLILAPRAIERYSRFFHLMDLTFTKYCAYDVTGEFRESIARTEVQVRGVSKALDIALALYHTVFGVLAFRPLAADLFEEEVNYYLRTVRPLLWELVSKCLEGSALPSSGALDVQVIETPF